MTDEKIALRTLLEKGSDATFLREMIGFAAQRVMELESEALCGAGHDPQPSETIRRITLSEKNPAQRIDDRTVHRRDPSGFLGEFPCLAQIANTHRNAV